ncbi:hypothetical protein WJX74_003725 [Apatococcus lobatus]|uniref:Dynamin-type G domain-containing protein n=2 Tax=Apatococcus TaxID=904362 RepID=A0AAW1TDC9_9CHLO
MPAVSAEELYANETSRLRFEAFSRLQAAAVAFGEQLPIPEIVAIGGQSDGKSSLLEAFLGFRFNVREVEMGTRRPLIVQMVHDPTAEQPRCRLQEEDSEEYGPLIMPETAVSEAIREMTDRHLRTIGAPVSAKPIVMRAEFAYCPNLTIIDTPGFILKARKGEPDSTPDDILDMVKAQARPAHRLILFLQQSSVEWCSALWMHVVQEVDPNFQRTIVVASKFDNRLKEFAERWEVDRYLSASGYLHQNVKPFFVALPKDRAMVPSGEWRSQIQQVDAGILHHLRTEVAGGFDEERFGARVGFGNLKLFLEEELARRYRDASPTMLALLQERCESAAAQLMAAEAQLNAAEDVASLRRAAMQHVFAVARRVAALLDGATDPDPAQHGLTTEEERTASTSAQWPGGASNAKPPNAGLRLYGGAAFERCLAEFQEAALELGCPAVGKDKVANVLLPQRARGGADSALLAAQEIARSSAREVLSPLLDTACARLSAVLRRAFDIAVDSASQSAEGTPLQALRPYVAFHASLRGAYQSFVGQLEEQCRSLVQHHLEAATSSFAVSLLGGVDMEEEEEAAGVQHGDEENEPPDERSAAEEGIRRLDLREPLAESQMTVPETPSPDMAFLKGGGRRHGRVLPRTTAPKGPSVGVRGAVPMGAAGSLTPGGTQTSLKGDFRAICLGSERLFARIRQAVAVQAAPATLRSAFLEPISQRLAGDLSLELFARRDEDVMGMFAASGAVAVLEASRETLARRVENLVKCKNEFQELARCL